MDEGEKLERDDQVKGEKGAMDRKLAERAKIKGHLKGSMEISYNRSLLKCIHLSRKSK